MHIVLKALKSVGAKGDIPKIRGFMHPLQSKEKSVVHNFLSKIVAILHLVTLY